MEKGFIGIDLGTSSAKIALVSENKKLLDVKYKSYGLKIGDNGLVEQNPEDWFKAINEGIHEIIENNSKIDVRGIGLTGQWSGTVPVDKDGNNLHDAIIWMDTRGKKIIEKVTGGFPSISKYRIDKLIKWLRKTGGAPAHSGKDSIAHILFLKDEMHEIYDKTYKFLEPKDYIAMKLTGKFKASWDNIVLLWVTDNRDPNNIKYDDELIKMVGIDKNKLPEIIKPTDIVGLLKKEISKDLNLPDNVPIVSGCGDMHSSLIGAGLVNDFESLLYLGTSSWITAHVPFKKTDIFHNIASIPAGIPGKFLVAAEQENACNCMEFISNMLGIDQEKYKKIDEMAIRSNAGSNNLIFLPWVFGERAPVEDPYIRGGFFNLSLIHSDEDMIRSVMEGVAFNSKWLLSAVEKFIGRRINSIIMSGGGALSDIRVKIFSNVLGRDIFVIDRPRDSGVKGAALLAAVGTGNMEIKDLAGIGKPYKEFKFNIEENKKYERIYKEFLNFYKNNKKSMHILNS
ncbi:MAG: xylulokinase [Thermoplasmata archaeon]